MIRELGPVVLIPAAWTLTFLTAVYPGVDTYWIEHMHYFMILFLAGFTVTSWRQMDRAVLSTWRWVIAIGLVPTVAGAVSFSFDTFDGVLAGFALLYWLVAPGIAAHYTSDRMAGYGTQYRAVGYAGVTAGLLYSLGILLGSDPFRVLGIATALVSQTYAMVVAARLDGTI